MSWEKEEKIIEGLGKLYPEFLDWYMGIIKYESFSYDNWDKACWIYYLCKYHLNRRIPSLEKFIEKHRAGAWFHYNRHFKIKNEKIFEGGYLL